jgi:hypothetical protein
MTEDGADALSREAVYLGRQVFGVELPSSLVEAYVRANRQLLAGDSTRDAVLESALARAVREQRDVEAVELVLRLARRDNLITRKVHVLSYLIETQPSFLPLYLNERRAPVRAWAALATHGLRAIWKRVRGRRVLRRLGLPRD